MSGRPQRLDELLPEAGIDAMLVTNLVNLRYLTGYSGTNGLAVAGIVCAVSSIGLLVISLGLSFIFSLPLALTGWACAARAPKDVRPSQRNTAKILAKFRDTPFITTNRKATPSPG